MRRRSIGPAMITLGLALSACASNAPPDRAYPVFFNDFSASLDPTATEIVANAAAIAKRYPRAKVSVTGYADRIGTPEQEVALSRQRAEAVASLLQQDGVAASRLSRAAIGTPPNSQPGVERRRVEIDIDLP